MHPDKANPDIYHTHQVFNQPPVLSNYNIYESNPILRECVQRAGASWAEKHLTEFGAKMGSEEVIRWGFLANQNAPVLKTHDRFGNRIDEVEFHPSWRQLMELSISYGLHNLPWAHTQIGAHTARAALMMIASETEFGHLCPISMTFSIFPVLRKQPELIHLWGDKLLSNQYDPRFTPYQQKNGVLCGMAMTEKQSGSDVRANTSWAIPMENSEKEFLLTGHKWFCSAPMVDAFLVLAQTAKGLSCFFLPRYLPDGNRNQLFIQRLKDKLGNRSNASGEIEFMNAWAHLVGEEGRGIATIIEMVNHTRLDCTIGSTGLMHQALVQSLHHCRHRSAFGKKLIDQPLMKNVLADLCLETEAAIQLSMRLAAAYDQRENDQSEEFFQRIVTPVTKFWICKRTPAMIYEALECLGGNGYVEESMMPRLYREAPLNSVWEGSGNVICLDVIRAINNQPEALESVILELEKAKGMNTLLDQSILDFKKSITQSLSASNIAQSRVFVEKLALLLQASLLARYSPAPIAEAFIDSRLNNHHFIYGTLSAQFNPDEILKRMWPDPDFDSLYKT